MNRLARFTAAAWLAATAYTVPAVAADTPPPIVSALINNFKAKFQVEPTYEKIETDGATVTLQKLAAEIKRQDRSFKFVTDVLRFEDVGPEADHNIPVGKMLWKNTRIDLPTGLDKFITITIPEIAGTGVMAPTSAEPLDGSRVLGSGSSLVKNLVTSPITVTVPDDVKISSDGYESQFDGDQLTGAGHYKMVMKDFVIDEKALSALDPSGQFKLLGYSSAAVGYTGEGDIAIAGDNFSANGSATLTSKDMGNLTISFKVSDVPLAMIKELQRSQLEGREPDFTPIMPQLQNVSISSVTLRFDDQSITKRILPILAKRQGSDEPTLIATAGAMLQVVTGGLKNPAFTQQAVAAVNSYLTAPKSLTIAANPSSPVKVSQITASDPNNPGALIDLLGVKISAND